MAWRRDQSTPWSSASALFQPKPIPNVKRPRREMVERGDLLGQHDRIMLSRQKDPGAQADALGGGDRSREGDEGAKRPAIVLEPDSLHQRRGDIGPQRQMGVFGEEEGVEAPVLDSPGQRSGRHVAVGQKGGDAELHDAQVSFFTGAWRAVQGLRGDRSGVSGTVMSHPGHGSDPNGVGIARPTGVSAGSGDGDDSPPRSWSATSTTRHSVRRNCPRDGGEIMAAREEALSAGTCSSPAMAATRSTHTGR